MMKFRIAIQRYGDSKPVEFRSVMLESDADIDVVTRAVKRVFWKEHERWKTEFLEWLLARYHNKRLKDLHGIGTDLFDKAAVGEDITVEEFVKNEIGFALEEGSPWR